MRPVVVTSILLLVVLMSMWTSAVWTPAEMCSDRYKTPCNANLGDNWFQMGNRCVKAFIDPNQYVTFDAAEAACKEIKSGNFVGQLASIHSLEELCQVECAMYKINTGKAHYWIGLRRQYDENGFSEFVWTDGTWYDYGNWDSRQPDNFMFREDCVEMNYWGWGLWNDEACYEKRPYVCAVKVW